MYTPNIPATGEQAISGWIIATIIIAGLLLLVSVLYPYLPKILKKLPAKKDENNENLD